MTDHPYTDPGDGRTKCQTCGKYVWLVIHSCKGVRVKECDFSLVNGGCEECQVSCICLCECDDDGDVEETT